MDFTANLALPLIAPDQAQKHLTHNEALRVLDAILHVRVIDRDLATPPTTPSEGDRYLVASGGGDAWLGHDDAVAAFQDGGWLFYPPGLGWIAFVIDEARFVAWTGAAWTPLETSVNPVPLVGVNTIADPINRLAVKSDAVLFSHDDVTPGSGHIRLALNKANVAEDAGLVFQTGYSARALMGTLGDDTFQIKTSPDGASYQSALSVDPSTGRVTMPQGLDTTAVNGSLRATASGEAALVGRSTGFFPIAGIRSEASANPSALSLEKSRGAVDAPAAVQSGDGIASVTVRAFDGVSWVSGGQFRFNVETFNGVNDYTSNWRLDLRTGTGLATALLVNAALSLGVGTTTPSARLHVAGPIRHEVFTVGTLPDAATVGAGTRAAVTDAATLVFGAVVAGGGTTFAPVISDGTSWRVG